VPQISVAFWLVKIAATALGWTALKIVFPKLAPTGANSSPPSYAIAAAVTAAGVIGLIWVQLNSRRFDPWSYWCTMVVATICATSAAGLSESVNGVSYPVAGLFLIACFGVILLIWLKRLGTIDLEHVATPDAAAFYWGAIVLSQAAGIGLADFVADAGLGYTGAAAVFAVAVAGMGYAHLKTSTNWTILFWLAFVLTCPVALGIADFLLAPLGHGGLALTPTMAGAILAVTTVAFIYLLPQRSARHSSQSKA
jgi:uncharacterized membrane-anchored protein